MKSKARGKIVASEIPEVEEKSQPNVWLFLIVGLLAGFALAVSAFSVPLSVGAALRPIIAIIALEIGVVAAFIPYARQRRRSANNEKGETPAWHMRIDVEKYRTMSEGQRQTYIGGALDMLCYSYPYIAPRYQRYIVTMDSYFGQFDIGEIKTKFEVHLESADGKEKQNAAGVLFAALFRWSGLDG